MAFKYIVFRVILGRRIQIRRDKNFWATPWASTGLVISIIFTKSPVLDQGVVQKFFLDGFELYDPKLP
jgi:hypothetical protein